MDAFPAAFDSPYDALSSFTQPSSLRRFFTYCRKYPLECLQSFLSFHHYAVVSYTLIALHFLLFYLTTFFLLYDRIASSSSSSHTLPPQPYLVLLSFLSIRSLCLTALYITRLRCPALWYRSPSSSNGCFGQSGCFVLALTLSRASSIAFLAFGALHWLLLTPPSSAADDASFVATSAAVPCLLLRECVSLMLPIAALAYLRSKGWRGEQLTAFIPYIRLTQPAPQQPSHNNTAPLDQRRGMTAAEIAQLGEEKHTIPHGSCDEAEVCAVCLSELSEGVRVRRLRCQHSFHVGCVDVWLRQRGTCPLCVQHCVTAVACSVAIGPLVDADVSFAVGVGMPE